MSSLGQRVAADLAMELPHEVRKVAQHLADDGGVVAVLFYGAMLRTGGLDGLLDFYVLTDGSGRRSLIWPRVSFHAVPVGGRVLRAKVATMPLAAFADAARGRRLDTTVWTRFCQPSALAWSRDAAAASAVADAVAAAIVTAAGHAAVHGPGSAPAEAFWTALFDRTYHAELRLEAPGRSAAIVAYAPDRYAQLLPLAWTAGGIAFVAEGDALHPYVPQPIRHALVTGWRRNALLGKALNLVRLLRAALTLREAGSYALWKIRRHTDLPVEASRWEREHPVLAAPRVLWKLSRNRRQHGSEAPADDPEPTRFR